MGFLTFQRRGLGGSIAYAPPAPPTTSYHGILDAAVTRKHLPLNDTAPTTTAVNRGATAGNGTYVNVAGIRYSLGSLISGDPTSMRSIALSGATSSPPHITVASLVTGKSWTIDIALQLDRQATKMMVATMGLAQGVAGGVSIEVESDGASGMRARCWTSVGGIARTITSDPGTVPIGAGCKLTYRQAEGVGRLVYIDGIQVGSDTTFTAFEDTPAGTWYIGAWSDGAAPFDGLIAEIASWNTAVAAATITTLGGRAQDVLELATPPAQAFLASSSGSIDVVALGVANPAVNWTVEVVSAGLNSSLTAFTASGQSINWTTGASAGSASPTIRLTRGGGAMVSATRTVSITVSATPPPVGDACYDGAGGTVQAPSFTERETFLALTGGGNTRYNLSNASMRLRWLNNALSGGNADTTPNFLSFRMQEPHNGACISRGLVYGNPLPEDNRNSTSPWAGKTWILYPGNHGGHYFISGGQTNQIKNIRIEYCRSHGTWDVYRINGSNQASGGTLGRNVSDILVTGCWDTNVRDDWLENDTPCHNIRMIDNLIGDRILENNDNENSRGAYVILSTAHTGSAEDRSAHVYFENNLAWICQQKTTFGDSRHTINGFGCGNVFKINLGICPRHHIINNFFVVDHAVISSSGNPFVSMFAGPSNPSMIATVEGQTGESRGNIIWYRDLAGAGKYAISASDPVWDLPPGFTLIMGEEGRQEWNLRVANWKAAHPLVRRMTATSIPRPVGGNITIPADVG